MGKLRWIGISAGAVGLSVAVVCGQTPVPLADPVERSLTPSAVSHLSVTIDGPLAYLFKDEDGVDVIHVLGGFDLSFGESSTQRLRAREGIVWLSWRESQGRRNAHLEIMLWRDAEIREGAGTLTTAPALFVSLDTFGQINVAADEVAYSRTVDSQAYQDGLAVRKVFAEHTGEVGAGSTALRVVNMSGAGGGPKKPKQRPVIQYRSTGTLTGAKTPAGQEVFVGTGGVYLSRGVPGAGDYLEIRADSIVVFLPEPPRKTTGGAPPPAGLGEASPVPSGANARKRERIPDGTGTRQLFSSGLGEVSIAGAYLEGDVRMGQGPNTVRASRLYYDFIADRAIILDAVVRTALVDRNIPLYLRAAEIHQLSRTHFSAVDAKLTTSEFHTPHYHIGAAQVDLINLTPAETPGGAGALASGSFRLRRVTMNVHDTPVLFWPYIQGHLDTSETTIKSLRLGFSDDFGFEFESDWQFFNLLGLRTPPGVEATLSIDEFTRRGPAIGLDATYERDKYFGLLRSYVLSDDGKDSLGRERETGANHQTRGRVLVRHRQYLENDWELTLELSYISDRDFLEEFFEHEFDNDKEQETLLRLNKQTDNTAFTATWQHRILDFTTQTERLPDFAYFVMGEPVADRWTWFSENRVGVVRYRPKDQRFFEFVRDGHLLSSSTVARIDSRQEFETPLDLGPVRVVPFASVRASAWDDSPSDGGLGRVFTTYGVRGSMYLSRVYPDTKSSLFDLDGVRHIIKPELVAWGSNTNVDSHDLFDFDQAVEGIEEVDGVAFSVRQRWQTKRGVGENRRTVDFLTVDVGAGFFNDADPRFVTNGYTSFSRPEASLSSNYVDGSAILRLNDRTALVSEVNYDANDGDIGVWNVSAAVERSPRISYLLGYRFINESDSSLLGFDLNYRLTEKHSLALRESFDLDRGRTVDFTLALIRKFPRWFGALSFALDEAEDDFGVSFSIWPEGFPRAALGSRRFTGVTAMSNSPGG